MEGRYCYLLVDICTRTNNLPLENAPLVADYWSMSDERLVQLIVNGDTQNYGELVRRYESPLLRYVVFLIHDRELAEDILQDTFIKAYRNLAGFNTRLKFSSWIYRIAHNTAMDAVRKHHSIAMEATDLNRLTTVEPKIAEQIDRQILARDVSRCLAKLSAKYRAPVILYHLQQKSYAEISDILRIPTATVGVRISRAKTRLRAICKRMEVTV